MAQISFYINDNERMELFEFLVNNNAQIIPKKRYKKNIYEYVENKIDFLNIIEKETVSFFILSNKYSEENLLLERNEFSEEGYFLIMQRYGGPYINLELYRGFADDSAIQYKRTDLHYYPKYIDLKDSHKEFKASDNLKNYFNNIVKYLKLKCKKIKVRGKGYWISQSVINEIKKIEQYN